MDSILKPDSKAYDPHKFLEYNVTHHRFYPNRGLSDADKERVTKMLNVLCINYGKVVQERRDYLEAILKEEEFTGRTPDIHQFPTAFAMLAAQRQE